MGGGAGVEQALENVEDVADRGVSDGMNRHVCAEIEAPLSNRERCLHGQPVGATGGRPVGVRLAQRRGMAAQRPIGEQLEAMELQPSPGSADPDSRVAQLVGRFGSDED